VAGAIIMESETLRALPERVMTPTNRLNWE
jgi:hypothetical protein